MPPVIWDLVYPTATPDQLAVFRHNYETFRLDRHVASIHVFESEDNPNVMSVQVEFASGFNGPDCLELRHANSRYPVNTRPLPLSFEMPRIRGGSSQEVGERLREVSRALHSQDLTAPSMGLGPGIHGYTPPITIPKWVGVGCTYRLRDDDGSTVTLKRVRVLPGNIMVEVVGDGGLDQSFPLAEFGRRFELYERPKLGPSAWDRILQDDD